MMLKALLLPTLGSLAHAQSSVTSMFILGAGPQPLDASIVGNDAGATTYSINCPPGTPSDECGMGPGMTVVADGEMTTYIIGMGDEFQFTASCSVREPTALCTESAGGFGANFPGVSTTTERVAFMPVTVTAGEVTGAASETATATSSETLTAGTETGASGSATASGTESDADADAEATPTGAAAKVTGGAAVAGVVVALVGAVL
ncbi:hypothetical protein BDW62DRAFT_47275 [Aspergillus aurantiobrunneus]